MKNAIIGFMFVACALFGFNNYGYAQTYQNGYIVYENYAVPAPVQTIVTQSVPQVQYSYNSYAPVVQNRTPVRNFIQNQVLPQQQTFSQPVYQSVTETRYKRVCNGRGACRMVPYSVTVLKRVQ